MLDEAQPGVWFVRRDAQSAPEALVESFAGGYRLAPWSLIEADRQPLGVHTSPAHAETAWWRHRGHEATS